MLARRQITTVDFAAPVEVVYDYLSDPRHRPEWQASLRSVEPIDEGEVRVGLRWRDHTVPGMVPEMRITELQRGVRWAETGAWRGVVVADLVLDFAPRPDAGSTACQVVAAFGVRGRGLLAPLGWVATRAGVLAVRADLRRAARILAERQVA